MSTEGDSYLEIAERVLRRARSPLSTKQIIDLAYMTSEVPHHLYGATQHKTLGARLSEDILKYRKRSRFFRTKPGRFFLREFISDRSIPIENRTPIVATRRRRQLRRKNVAAVDRRLVSFSGRFWHRLEPDAFAEIVKAGGVKYVSLDSCPPDLIPIHSYVIIRRGSQILLHTKGSYAESRRGYVSKEMLGFPVPICHDDLTLFDIDDHGLVTAGLTAVANDLDLEFSAEFPSFELSAKLQCLLPVLPDTDGAALLGVVSVEAHQTSNRSVADWPLEILSGGRQRDDGANRASTLGPKQFCPMCPQPSSRDSYEYAVFHLRGGALSSRSTWSGR